MLCCAVLCYTVRCCTIKCCTDNSGPDIGNTDADFDTGLDTDTDTGSLFADLLTVVLVIVW